MSKNTRNPDPHKYATLNKPFENTKQADVAIEQFFAGVGKLREECCIPDVLMVLRIPYVADDGTPRESILPLSYGDERNMEALAAMGFGWAAKCRQDMIASIIHQTGGIHNPKGG